MQMTWSWKKRTRTCTRTRVITTDIIHTITVIRTTLRTRDRTFRKTSTAPTSGCGTLTATEATANSTGLATGPKLPGPEHPALRLPVCWNDSAAWPIATVLRHHLLRPHSGRILVSLDLWVVRFGGNVWPFLFPFHLFSWFSFSFMLISSFQIFVI